ncbi:MAG: hypothetical protein M1819_003190 [Sarea resinae]|nr:MAG: hypothetical protein M1819_003190 [Sarea resinae]
MANPKISTYHCAQCTQLLLATTYLLPSPSPSRGADDSDSATRQEGGKQLQQQQEEEEQQGAKVPSRRPPGLDGAFILPLLAPPRASTSVSGDPDDAGDEDDGSENEDNDGSENESMAAPPPPAPTTTTTEKAAAKPSANKNAQSQAFTLPLAHLVAPRAARATIVQRPDGFEKRHLWRCGRCRCVVAYTLDGVHYASAGAGAGDTQSGSRGGDVGVVGEEGEGREREREKRMLYVLRDALVSTEELKAIAGRSQ